MDRKIKNMRQQIIDFANHAVNPNDKDYIRDRKLTDKEFQRMIQFEYMQIEDKIDQKVKKLLEDEEFKRIMQQKS